VESNGGRFAKNLLRVFTMKKSIQIIEHTPVYDLKAFKQRQKKRKIHQLFKNLIETFTFLCAVFMTFSILFIGG